MSIFKLSALGSSASGPIQFPQSSNGQMLKDGLSDDSIHYSLDRESRQKTDMFPSL